jgi:hypothetical protein
MTDLLGTDPTAQLNLREDPERGVYVVNLTYTVHALIYWLHAVLFCRKTRWLH